MFIVTGTLLSTAFGLLRPWPMKILVDHVLATEPMSESLAVVVRLLPGGGTGRGLLVWVVLAEVVVFLVNSLADVLLTRTWLRVGQRMVYDLAADLFARLQRCSLLYHGRTPVGDSLSRITGDSWCVYKLVDTLLFAPAVAVIMVIGMVVLMISLDPRLTLLALAVTPFLTGSSLLLRGPLRVAMRAHREIESRIQSQVQRTLRGVQVVQAFTREEREQQRFRQLTEDDLRAQRRTILLSNLRGLASGLIARIGGGAVLWLGARHVLDGSLSLGSLLMFLAYLASLQGHLKTFSVFRRQSNGWTIVSGYWVSTANPWASI